MEKNIYVTEESQRLTGFESFVELIEEVQELGGAITRNDIENLGEELMDIMQWVYNISYKYDIDLNRETLKHHAKLLERGHQFVLFK